MELNLYEGYYSVLHLLKDIYLDEISEDDIWDFKSYLLSNDMDNLFYNFIYIIDSLKQYNIDSQDFLGIKNLGYKRNTKILTYFDIGYGNNDSEQILEKLNIGKFYVEDEKEIFNILEFDNISLLGGAGNGEAFEINDNKVLKITIDISEVYNSYLLMNKKINNLNYIYDVYELSILGTQKKWVIIQDKVDTPTKEIQTRYNNLNNLFLEFKKTL